MFNMFDALKQEVLYTFQEPYNEKSFKKIKHYKSLQNTPLYLEPMRTSTMEIFCEYT